MRPLIELHNAISAVCPIDGVTVVDPESGNAVICYAPSADQQQRAAADAVLAAWDWDAAPTTWHMPASEFQTLLTDDELTAIQLSIDPNVIRLRTWIQTIRDDVQSEDVRLIGGINYLAYVAGLLTTPRAARILAGQEPE